MNVVIIDAQGGGMGKAITESLKRNFPSLQLTCVGTNALATSAMLHAGADHGATGENAIRVCCETADLIICPIGLILADAMLGEVTSGIAIAIGKSRAHRILIPSNRCHTTIAGCQNLSMQDLIQDVNHKVRLLLE